MRVVVMKRELSVQEAIEVCFIIFEKNCEAGALQAFQKQTFLSSVPFAEFAKEWHAFVFAAVYHGFSQYAPAYMVLEYVRSIKYFLKEYGYDEKETALFLDNQFQAYIRLIIEEKVKDCPELFCKRLLAKGLCEMEKRSVVLLSGAMAMLVANCLDIFENYTYSLN